PREALEWIPLGTRRRGRPKQTWRRSVAADMKTIGLTCLAAHCGCPLPHYGDLGH
ncbi:hypothetical protein RR48_13464, partial [Papilio machaon]